MSRTVFAVGDLVTYHPYAPDDDNSDGVVYQVERDYGNKVYFIGNADAFIDLVPSHMLRKVPDWAG